MFVGRDVGSGRTGVAPEMGMPRLWSRINNHARSAGRFDRNLVRLLAGFEASLPR